jgi:two-component system NtrC family response regulator
MTPSLDTILIGRSGAMRELRRQIERFGPTQLPALIRGPTGSGKELIARALHQASGRAGAFIAFNVCALSDTMFEDALFGHVRGAFTGATGDRAGYLAEANGGTVFLDEIGGTAPMSQSKLLRAVETRTFRAVGASRDRVSDFRLIAATNEPLERMVAQGQFRRDLFHRLAGVVFHVPALETRREDIADLAHHFVGPAREITEKALQYLSEASWPGNVRELRHALDRAGVLAGDGPIGIDHVREAASPAVAGVDAVPDDAGARAALLRVLVESNWDTSAAAERLGVHRATVYRRMKQLSLDSDTGLDAGVNARVIA